ncbi:MAG: UDP-N-acetylmuramoyl-tripeptide--D-alanyl-D-alanine ligase [Burkholderiales bacterium]|nr:UDP-N-acetylmuramoyl-tripeptide--D-alanyl-D-alanine ligase [Burkholderiales bacterium]
MNAMDSLFMMQASDVAKALGAELIGGDAGERANISRVTTDSRSVQPGDLFVALVGPTFDGHDFAMKAAQSGATAVLVSRALAANVGAQTMVPQIVVPDTRLALGRLARWWRRRFALPMIALTGSNGKTSTKEMLRSILAVHSGAQGGDGESVLATEGNLNNDIGMPLTLLRLRAHHRYAVIEMGMNHLLEIDYLTRLAEPDVALVINAGTAHIGELGSREAIAQAKGEIYAGLKAGGIAVINLHDRFGSYWQGLVADMPGVKPLTFGVLPEDDVWGEFNGDVLTIHHAGEQVDVTLAVPGDHNLRNALAAAAGAVALGVPLANIREGLLRFRGVSGRMQMLPGDNGARVIHDAYNANPDSVRAAIDVLAQRPGRRILVLGDMGELGADAERMHAEIGDYIKGAGLDGLFALGKLTEHTVLQLAANAWHFDDATELAEELRKHMDADTTVLVKGSRFMKMERVVEQIAIGFDADKRAEAH